MKPIYLPTVAAELEQLQPLGDFVLVKRLPDAEREGSIIIPATVRNPERGLRRGIVIACGPGDKLPDESRYPIGVQPGDQVIYSRSPANDICLNGDEYVFLHEEQHILGVVENQ